MFRPSRASSPSKTKPASSRATTHSDSFASAPELTALAPDEIEFIDAVVARAGPGASTFLAVLKAYNDVLRERGMDSRNEVIYYGKLLKLGTLKGADWAAKWAAVRASQPALVAAPPSWNAHAGPSRAVNSRLVSAFSAKPREPDTFTLHSHADEDEDEDTTHARERSHSLTPRAPTRIRPRTRTLSGSPESSVLGNSLGLDTGPLAPALAPHVHHTPTAKPRPPRLWDSVSDASDDHVPGSSASILQSTPVKRRPPVAPRQRLTSDPHKDARPGVTPVAGVVAPTAAHRAVAEARERRGGVIDDGAAWDKIRRARDESDADALRRERLLLRTWAVWRAGAEWARTTNEQIAAARDTLLQRRVLQRWRTLATQRVALAERVTHVADARMLRRALIVWGTKLQERRQAAWRADMRARMQAVRKRREATLLARMLVRWHLEARGRVAERLHMERVVAHTFVKWKSATGRVGALEEDVEVYGLRRDARTVELAWERWQWAMDFRRREAVMVQRVAGRVLGGAWDAWKKRMRNIHLADAFHDRLCIANALRSWKTAQGKIRRLERKADKHLARQDDVLVRAIVRVWKAHERGRLLERVRDSRLLKRVWAVWTTKLASHQHYEGIASTFAQRPGSALLISSFHAWQRACVEHQNAGTLANEFRAAHVQAVAMHTWRLALRARLRLNKQARVAERYFAMRGAWSHWRAQMAERTREQKLIALAKAKKRKIFITWLKCSQRQTRLRTAEQQSSSAVNMRIVRTALSKWTNRVINLKLRELEIVQRSEHALLVSSMKKWKTIVTRHVEELSLMESYKDVKREEIIRKTFHKWLNAARNSHHLRMTLEAKEQEMRLARMTAAWDKWRDRYKDERLRVTEKEVILQTQRNLVFRSFGIWLSKTQSLPAIRFAASHTKVKAWRRWRASMPQALQAKVAREMHSKSMLQKHFKQWLAAYRSKIALKAVARARYLRLPATAPRQAATIARPPALATVRPPTLSSRAPILPASRPVFPRATVREATPDHSAEPSSPSETGPSRLSPFSSRPAASSASRTGLTSLLSGTPRTTLGSATTPSPRPRLFPIAASTTGRDASPTRSRSSFLEREHSPSRPPLEDAVTTPNPVASEPGRSSLWVELQTVQRKPRTPTEYTRGRSREPT